MSCHHLICEMKFGQKEVIRRCSSEALWWFDEGNGSDGESMHRDLFSTLQMLFLIEMIILPKFFLSTLDD